MATEPDSDTDRALADYRVAQRAAGLLESTITARHYHLMSWCRFVDPWDAKPADVRRWVGQSARGANARCSMVSHLHRFYIWAISEDLAASDPTIGVQRPKRPRRVPRPAAEQDLVLAVDMAPSPLVRAWLLLAGYCGLRCIELSRLRWADVDLGHRARLTVVGKGNHERSIPLHPEVVGALADLPRAGVYIAGEPISASAVSQRINRHLHSLGITSTAHQLRHRAATVAYDHDHDLIAVQRLLGHASIETTQIYTDVNDEAVRRAVSSMPSLSELRQRQGVLW